MHIKELPVFVRAEGLKNSLTAYEIHCQNEYVPPQ